LPNVILEAFAAQVPVVATAVGGTPEIVENQINGLLAPPGDSRALARCLAELLSSEARRLTMGEQGRRVLRDFTFEAQASAYRRLFGELQRNRSQSLGLGSSGQYPLENPAVAKSESTARATREDVP
jgi:glycosyltransferase involved in cell wall biosynthesis